MDGQIFNFSAWKLQDLADKIASLNSAIDDVSAQLKAQDNSAEMAMSTNATPS